MKLGKKLKALRILKGVSSSQIASIINMSESNYNKIERNEIEIRMTNIEKLAKYFNLSLDVLIKDETVDQYIKEADTSFPNRADLSKERYSLNHITDESKITSELRIQILEEENIFLRKLLNTMSSEIDFLRSEINKENITHNIIDKQKNKIVA